MRARIVATCCLCVPLRLGVFLNAVATVMWSAFTILFDGYCFDTIRLFSGGHMMESRAMIGFIEYLGCIFGVVGSIGAWKQRADYVAIFKWYQVVRVIAWFGMLCVDVPLMMECELWTHDIDRALHYHGWNPVMYRIAIAGNCWSQRLVFFVFSMSAFVWFVYLAYMNHRYHTELEDEPRYLLKVPHMSASGAFFCKPSNEWSAMMAEHGTYHPPVYGTNSRTTPTYGMEPTSYNVDNHYFDTNSVL